MNVCPQNRGSVFGKQIDTSMWFASMSSSRSFCFQQPGRISSNVVVAKARSPMPTAADRRENGETRSS